MKRIKALNVRSAVQVAIENTRDAFLELQVDQMHDGKQATGSDIQLAPLAWFPGYSPEYARRRERAGLQTSHVDLDFTGIFQADLALEVEGELIKITSHADYEKWVTLRFGKKIWGLGGEYLRRYKEQYFQPALALAIREQSGLNIRR